MKTDAEYAAAVAELEDAQRELNRIKLHSFYREGLGTVYGDELMVKHIERLSGFNTKTNLKVVEH